MNPSTPSEPNHAAAATKSPSSSGKPPRKSLVEKFKQWDTWWSILLLLFCVTAACGLPILWVSKAYRPTGKVALSILVTLYTLAIFWLFWVVMVWCYQRIVESF